MDSLMSRAEQGRERLRRPSNVERRLLVALVGLAVSSMGFGACQPNDTLKAYLQSDRFATLIKSFPDYAFMVSIVIVTFDHRNRSWDAFRCKKATPCDLTDRVPLDLRDATPRVKLRRHERVTYVITNTNPLAFGLENETLTYTELPDMAAIRTILETLAGYATAWLKTRGAPFGPLDTTGRPNIDTIVQPLRDRVESLTRAIEAAISYVRSVEATGEGVWPGDPADWTAITSDLQKGFLDLREAVAVLRRRPEGCPSVLTVGSKARDLGSEAAKDLGPKAVKLVRELEADALCGERQKEQLLAILKDLAAVKSSTPDAEIKVLFARLEKPVALAEITSNLIVAANALTAKERETMSAASDLALFAWRIQESEYLPRNGTAGNTCNFSAGLIPTSVRPADVKFEKEGKVTFAVAGAKPFGVAIAGRRTPVSGEFRFAGRAESLWGFGPGIIYTPLVNPTWSAVQNPLNKDQKVIARKSEEARAGDIAVFANYRLPFAEHWVVWPGVQFGVGAKDKIEVFLGVSFDLGPFVRLGAGETLQQVDRLVDSQTELRLLTDGTADPKSLTVVSGDTDIRTRKKIRDAWYLSLTIALDGIPLFKPKT